MIIQSYLLNDEFLENKHEQLNVIRINIIKRIPEIYHFPFYFLRINSWGIILNNEV